MAGWPEGEGGGEASCLGRSGGGGVVEGEVLERVSGIWHVADGD